MKLRTRRRNWVIVVILLFLVVAEAYAFLFPPTHVAMPADAIVVFGGPGDRTAYAAELADKGLATTVVISIEDVSRCKGGESALEVVCLTPDPLTTQGEARAFADLAHAQGWDNLLVVSTATQSVRVRLRLGRCYEGDAQFVTMRETFLKQMYRVIYENGAILKASILEREC